MPGKKIPIPREHGVYVVLAGSWMLGLIHASEIHIPYGLLMLIAGLCGTVLSGTIRELLRSFRSPLFRRYRKEYLLWTGGAAGTLAASLTPVVLARPGLLWFALPAVTVAVAYLRMQIRKRSLILQSLMGFVGVSLLAPATSYAMGMESLAEMIGVWLLALLFFCGSILCVNIRLTGKSMVFPAGLYFLATLIVASFLQYHQLLPLAGTIGIALGVGRYLLIAIDVEAFRSLTLKAIGVGETVLTLLFLLVNTVL